MLSDGGSLSTIGLRIRQFNGQVPALERARELAGSIPCIFRASRDCASRVCKGESKSGDSARPTPKPWGSGRNQGNAPPAPRPRRPACCCRRTWSFGPKSPQLPRWLSGCVGLILC